MQAPEIETVSPSGIASTLPLSGFSEVADRFDLCLCDVWGVVHNGVAAYRDAVAALMRMRGRHVSLCDLGASLGFPLPADRAEAAHPVAILVADEDDRQRRKHQCDQGADRCEA